MDDLEKLCIITYAHALLPAHEPVREKKKKGNNMYMSI